MRNFLSKQPLVCARNISFRVWLHSNFKNNLVFGIGNRGFFPMSLENVVNLNATTNAVERILFSIVDLSCPA